MANANVAQQQTIIGAQRSVMALKALEELTEAHNNPDTTWEQYHASMQSTAELLIQASGADTEQLRGFIAVIGEYLHMCQMCGVPNLDVWKPAATMTPEELADYRKATQEVD